MGKSFMDYVEEIIFWPLIVFYKNRSKNVRFFGWLIMFPWVAIFGVPILILIIIALTIEMYKEL